VTEDEEHRLILRVINKAFVDIRNFSHDASLQRRIHIIADCMELLPSLIIDRSRSNYQEVVRTVEEHHRKYGECAEYLHLLKDAKNVQYPPWNS
jgi:predicted enzyme involved in methoxymalonyl-ACP biosynthesis